MFYARENCMLDWVWDVWVGWVCQTFGIYKSNCAKTTRWQTRSCFCANIVWCWDMFGRFFWYCINVYHSSQHRRFFTWFYTSRHGKIKLKIAKPLHRMRLVSPWPWPRSSGQTSICTKTTPQNQTTMCILMEQCSMHLVGFLSHLPQDYPIDSMTSKLPLP